MFIAWFALVLVFVLVLDEWGGEAVFEVERGVELRESQGLKVAELSKAEQLANEHRQLIILSWNERFNR